MLILDDSKTYVLFGYDFYTLDFHNLIPKYSNATTKYILCQYPIIINANIEIFEIKYIKFQGFIADIGLFFILFQLFFLH